MTTGTDLGVERVGAGGVERVGAGGVERIAAVVPAAQAERLAAVVPAGRAERFAVVVPAGWAERIAAATPARRDRTVDALRAAAVVGVVLGHWLVSALVSDPSRPVEWHGASPLSHRPALIPATWVLQTLGPFFFAGGYAAACGLRGRAARPWLATRLSRLTRPVLVLAAVWTPALLLLRVTAAPASTRHAVWSLLAHPLWFLLVYLILTALTPVLRAAVARYRSWSVLPPVGLVAAGDGARHLGSPAWLALPSTVVGWAVPYLLGMALADGALPRRAGFVLLPAGVAVGVGLVCLAGYPASAVGVPGDNWSNLDPPSLFALALTAAQLGVFVLLRPALAGLLRRPAWWAPVALLNLAAMTVYCWHQTALLLVTFGGLVDGRLPGLLDTPTGAWPAYRVLWLPVFALVLAALCTVFHRFEKAGRPDPWGRPPEGSESSGGHGPPVAGPVGVVGAVCGPAVQMPGDPVGVVEHQEPADGCLDHGESEDPPVPPHGPAEVRR